MTALGQARARPAGRPLTRPGRTAARLAGAVATGLALRGSLPEFALWWLGPIGVTGLVLLADVRRARDAYLLHLLAWAALFVPLLEWTRFLGVLPWLLLVALQAALAALSGPLLWLVLGRRDRRTGQVVRLVGIVAVVVLVEAVRGRVPFGGLTWGRLAFGQADGPLLGLAALGGAPLVSAGVATIGAAGALLLRDHPGAWRPGPRRVLPLLLLPALVLVAATAVPRPVDGPLVQVAVVQGDVPGQGLSAFTEDLVVLDNHVRQTERLAADVAAGRRLRPDLVLWPENAADQDPRSEPQTAARLQAASRALGGQPFLLGAVLTEGRYAVNGLLVWGRDGVEGPLYAKRHLVPFGEYLPLRGLVERVYPAAGDLLPRDFRPGDRVGRLDLAGVPLAVGTCFEVAFDDLARDAVRAGGELLVLPSNNASYGRSDQSAQQLAMARLRAVEHGRSVAVPTTSGISALIRPDGTVVAKSGLYESAVLDASLPRRGELTIATRVGAWPEALLALLLVPGALSAFVGAGGPVPHPPVRPAGGSGHAAPAQSQRRRRRSR